MKVINFLLTVLAIQVCIHCVKENAQPESVSVSFNESNVTLTTLKSVI